MAEAFDVAERERWLDLVRAWISARPTASHPPGLARVREAIALRLEALGFDVRVHGSGEAAPILLAVRKPEVGARYVGLFAHYDVEEAGDGWSSEPFEVHVRGERAFGRGVGDNLGPLSLRLLALERLVRWTGARQSLPGLVWVLQGEEEIGSPWAHALFPTLDLPAVELWIEETGYFEEDGTQRLLARRIPPRLAPVLETIASLARAEAREIRVLDRYLNKAFGESRCPCLAHLVKDAPYLAIGPNDTRARIHAPNESLPLGTLPLASAQFIGVLHEVARCG
ncbi:M20/M25/M40 family metallo-hydrolase [Polyangium sp. 6x1]|uniref:M20/M25/M40 family metallo-hydrolase n=1 Tax=Polyangium sp. 6x1 TaxID=3042689 RepID=UPI002482C0DE|nr:M20/M25/M40 family metallo-hydrolase [Polyangium sp. 6x1]MDI1443602.1 M20/M25/M40 family metallo-hydrolase [Polyangium sp. 6x1]